MVHKTMHVCNLNNVQFLLCCCICVISQNLDPRQLSWNQELLEEIKEKLDLGPALGLLPHARFDCSNLVLFMEQYRLDSLEKTQ
jgi:hypothetical protein